MSDVSTITSSMKAGVVSVPQDEHHQPPPRKRVKTAHYHQQQQAQQTTWASQSMAISTVVPAEATTSLERNSPISRTWTNQNDVGESDDRNSSTATPSSVLTELTTSTLPCSTSGRNREDISASVPSATECIGTSFMNAASSVAWIDHKDEGMDLFRHPSLVLELPVARPLHSVSPSLTAANDASVSSDCINLPTSIARPGFSLYYTVGQAHISRKEYYSAVHWFNMALTHLGKSDYDNFRSKDEDDIASTQRHRHETATVLIQLHCNIGYCHYQLLDWTEALSAYQAARVVIANLIQPLPHTHRTPQRISYEEYDALVCNCLATVLLRASQQQRQHERHLDIESNQYDLSNSALAQAMVLFQRSLAALECIHGRNSKSVAMVLHNIGQVYFQWRQYASAISAYERALLIRRLNCGNESRDVAATLCNVAQAYHQCEKYEVAIEYYKQYLFFVELQSASHDQHRPPSSNDIALVYTCIADIYRTIKNMVQAKEWYKKAIQALKIGTHRCESSSAASSQLLQAALLRRYGDLLLQLHEYEEALLCYTDSLEIGQLYLRWNDPYVVMALVDIARLNQTMKRYHEAFIYYDQVHLLQIHLYGCNSIQVAGTLSSMGQLQYQQKDYETAFEFFQRALQIQRDYYGETKSPDVAITQSSLGIVLFNLGALDLAKTCFTDSLQISRSLLGADHSDIAILWYNLATIYLESGNDDTAFLMYKETLRIERKVFQESNKTNVGVIVTLQHLAVTFQQRGEFEIALHHFAEALDCERMMTTKNFRSIAKILNMMGNIYLQTGQMVPMMTCFIDASRIYTLISDTNACLTISGFPLYLHTKLYPPCAPCA